MRDGGGNPVTGVTAQLSGLKPGDYRVEFWDPVAGQAQTTQDASSADGNLALALPPITADLAIKVIAK